MTDYVAVEGEMDDGMPTIMIVNKSAESLRATGKYPWHLSIIVEAGEILDNGWPTPAENDVLKKVDAVFDEHIVKPGNAVWLARNTFDGVRQFIYRVIDPEIPHKWLQSVIESGDHLRAFDYEMNNDPGWEAASQYLAISKLEAPEESS